MSSSGNGPLGTIRRRERAIEDVEEIKAILQEGTVMHLAMVDDGHPFLLPLNYVAEGDCLYFHSAKAGRKMEVLAANPEVCFSVSLDHGVIEAPNPCDFEARHRTVIGIGIASPVTSLELRRQVLESLVARFTDRKFTFPDAMLEQTAVTEIRISQLTGKKHG
nr:pyridoxamine 5'-phosphate oxidase family protein [uncultured Holophaga sp.]